MASPLLHSDKSKPIGNITDAYSLEVNAKDISALTAAAPRVLPGSTISIPYLANQDNDARLAAADRIVLFLWRVKLTKKVNRNYRHKKTTFRWFHDTAYCFDYSAFSHGSRSGT